MIPQNQVEIDIWPLIQPFAKPLPGSIVYWMEQVSQEIDCLNRPIGYKAIYGIQWIHACSWGYRYASFPEMLDLTQMEVGYEKGFIRRPSDRLLGKQLK